MYSATVIYTHTYNHNYSLQYPIWQSELRLSVIRIKRTNRFWHFMHTHTCSKQTTAISTRCGLDDEIFFDALRYTYLYVLILLFIWRRLEWKVLRRESGRDGVGGEKLKCRNECAMYICINVYLTCMKTKTYGTHTTHCIPIPIS